MKENKIGCSSKRKYKTLESTIIVRKIKGRINVLKNRFDSSVHYCYNCESEKIISSIE